MDLYRYARKEDLEGCQRCLELGTNPNFQNAEEIHWTSLHIATWYGNYDCMKLSSCSLRFFQ
jgi:hypothetical protein